MKVQFDGVMDISGATHSKNTDSKDQDDFDCRDDLDDGRNASVKLENKQHSTR